MSSRKTVLPAPKLNDKKVENTQQGQKVPALSTTKRANRKERKRLKWRLRIQELQKREKKPEIESRWSDLPDLILERIFSYLSIRDRYYASCVCKRWYEAFYLPFVWSTFVMGDHTLVRRKFNYYLGWEYVLDHMRTQNCLATVGRNVRSLVFEPMYNFHNLYQFMVMLSYYAERSQYERAVKYSYPKMNLVLVPKDVRGGGMGIGSRISTLRFTFPCNMAQSARQEDEYIFGTGGQLLGSFMRLMGSLGKTLRHLQLVDLLLERHDALTLLDDVCYTGCETLESLELVNVTKVPCELLHPGAFINLQVLILSPQTLGPELLRLLGWSSSLRHLHLLQNRYTPERQMSAAWQSWRQCRRDNPSLSVHLEAHNTREGDVVWQQCAPVHSILYRSPYIRVSSASVWTAIDQYRGDLEVYGHAGLPRFYRPRVFHERADTLLLLLVRSCPGLHTLMVRERISTATVLLLAYSGQNLRYLHVRRNAVILKCDVPRSPEWSDTFYTWLRNAAKSYETTEREVSQLLGYSWSMLTDRQFVLTRVDVRSSPYMRSSAAKYARASFHTYVPPPLPTPVAELLPDTRRRGASNRKADRRRTRQRANGQTNGQANSGQTSAQANGRANVEIGGQASAQANGQTNTQAMSEQAIGYAIEQAMKQVIGQSSHSN